MFVQVFQLFVKMPRNNRAARADNNPNPLSSCIMLVQEKIKVLRHFVARCQCPDLELELFSLRNEHGKLQQAFRQQTFDFRKYKFKSQESFVSFRSRIESLLQV
jgi:hypothetical protein